MTGGGTGGHITPILAVAREIKRLHPDTRIVYVSHTHDQLDDIPGQDPNIDEIVNVRSGKFRRYHGEGLKQLLDLQTMYLNIRDGVFTLIGLWQSFWLLRRLKPAIIFTRGSFVSVPVCLAAAMHKIPYVTHDSDAIPSLTNRIIARWARLHCVALPVGLYPYPAEKTVTVGVPINSEYQPVTTQLRRKYKEELHYEGYDWELLITGGGLGSQTMNDAMVANAPYLLQRYPGLVIVHITGRLHQEAVQAQYAAVLSEDLLSRVKVIGFVTDMYRYTGSANLVIARGGATNLAELAVQAKPCIIIPSAFLTGGHQVKNTAALAQAGAVVQMSDSQIEQELRLASVVSDLFDHPDKLDVLSQKFAAFAKPDAAQHIARLLFDHTKDTRTA